MFNGIKRSLTAKIGLLTGGLIILAVIVFSVIFVYSESRDLKSETARAANIFATYSTPAMYDIYVSFYTRLDAADFLAFQKNVRAILQSNPDATNIQLLAINGKILMDSREAQSVRYSGSDRFMNDGDLLRMVQTGDFESRELGMPMEDGTSFQYVVPVKAVEGVHVLSMVYSFSYASYHHRLFQIYTQIALTAVALLILGLLLPMIFIRRTISPLRKLTAAAEEVGAGNYDIKIDIRDEDEIGILAQSFNLMSTHIKTKITELERIIRVTVGRELRMIELKKELKNKNAEFEIPSHPQDPKAPSPSSGSDIR